MHSRDHYADRAAAAQVLVEHLGEYRDRNPLVLGIPRGGVPMAAIIARQLGGECDVVLVHKLGAPFDPEYAIGAIDENGVVRLEPMAEVIGIPPGFLSQEQARQHAILVERRRQYGATAIDAGGRIAIVADDGVATGATMIAALHAVRARQPAELVCAVPVGAPESLARIAPLVDRLVCPLAPPDFRGVSQFYMAFPQVEDEEVMAALARPAQAAGNDEHRPV